jgi:hypothetical protein
MRWSRARAGAPALVMIGFSARQDLARDGLAEALGGDPVIYLPGGHDVHGQRDPARSHPA